MTKNMKDWMIAGAIFVAAFAGLSYLSNRTPSVAELSKSVVQIEDFCSGTEVKDYNPSDGIQDYVLTAKHCITGGVNAVGKTLTVFTDKDGKHYGEKFMVVSVDPDNDLALLQRVSVKDTWGVPALEVGDGKYEFGQEALTIGYPLALTLSASDVLLGNIITVPMFSDVSKDGWYQYATGLVSPGSSGSSLLVDGEIAGVLTGGAVVYILGYQTFWVPQERVAEFVGKKNAS